MNLSRDNIREIGRSIAPAARKAPKPAKPVTLDALDPDSSSESGDEEVGGELCVCVCVCVCVWMVLFQLGAESCTYNCARAHAHMHMCAVYACTRIRRHRH